MLNQGKIWKRILDYARKSQGKEISLLNPNMRRPFMITEVSDGYIRVDKLRQQKMTKQMFLGIYDYLKSKSGWVSIGTRRVDAHPDTVEGFIKENFFKGNMNGLSTATWFSAILVWSDIGVEFNNKAYGQKLRLTLAPQDS